MPFPQPGTGGIDQLTGDVTAGPGTGSQAATLDSVTTAETVGDATHYPIITTDAKGRVITATAQLAPNGPAPATTVTGPDAFGAAAVVGVGTTYARADHDHGLPAAPVASLSYGVDVLGADYSLTSAFTTALTTASLEVGTWLFNVTAQLLINSTATTEILLQIAQGTATASITPSACQPFIALNEVNSGYQLPIAFSVLVNVTAAGTMVLQGEALNAGGTCEIRGFGESTTITRVKIA